MADDLSLTANTAALSSLGPDPLDPVTGLPLVLCMHCKDIRIIALTCKWTKNSGKRFFKCPRNRAKDPSSCPSFFFQSRYEKHLLDRGINPTSFDVVQGSSNLGARNIGTDDPFIAMNHQISGTNDTASECKGRVDPSPHNDILMYGIFFFGAGIVFLIAAIVVLLAVLIYLVIIH